jgi:hypothetical protein
MFHKHVDIGIERQFRKGVHQMAVFHAGNSILNPVTILTPMVAPD